MKTIDKIIVSSTPPKDKNVAWFNGKSIKMPSQGKWKSTGGSGGGSGIEIVESVDKLDPNAPVGSLASVAVPGKITEISVRDMQQPDNSILDTENGSVITANLNTVTSISIDPSKVSFDGKNTMVYFCTENTSLMGGDSGVVLAVMKQSQGDVHIQAGMCMNMATREEKPYIFVQKNADGTTTVYQDQIDEFIEQFKQNTFYYLGFFEHMTSGMEITEEDYVSLDNIKVVSGIPSKVHIYRKADSWEELYKKDFEKIQKNVDNVYNALDSKVDPITIESIPYSKIIEPNKYYRGTINSTTGSSTFKLKNPTDSSKYSEYIVELKCTGKPNPVYFTDEQGNNLIKWANDIEPVFEKNYTYIISIVNNFGVFAQYVDY